MTILKRYTVDFSGLDRPGAALTDAQKVSLGRIFNALGPSGGEIDGFAITAEAPRRLLKERGLEQRLRRIFAIFNPDNVAQVAERGHAARVAVLETELPAELREEILAAYDRLCLRLGYEPVLAVRPSAAPEDLPANSFEEAAETFFNVRGREGLLRAVAQCFASLFTDRAIDCRARCGLDQLRATLSIGVMAMEHPDQAHCEMSFPVDSMAARILDRPLYSKSAAR
ncbi:MAG TPA: PEP/pyruvate-binding domain-containing protein [Blastocatellia bacterium]|nr:PEP/pyruvate-binding domain-containing protein [Blastocatellia bacterium]